jgi:tRNA nucleotidyltransferase/poly(A) polymerase
MKVNMINNIPKNVYAVLEALYDWGYEAYIVGGAVRDMLIGRKIKDYDITTKARPEETIALAGRKGWRVIDRLGQNFGVVMLVVEGTSIEVTAFRGERYGEDSHRPAKDRKSVV